MKLMSAILLGFVFLAQPVQAQVDMTQGEAAAYIQTNTYFDCETDSDCILTGNSCGQLLAINKAEHERYAVAAALQSVEMTCPPAPPQNTSDYQAVCRGGLCQTMKVE